MGEYIRHGARSSSCKVQVGGDASCYARYIRVLLLLELSELATHV